MSKKKKTNRIISAIETDSSSVKCEPVISPMETGRKRIRKVISIKYLQNVTKQAQLKEKERRIRLQENRSQYSNVYKEDAYGSCKEAITRKVVLEVHPISKEGVVEVDSNIVKRLKPHQINGVIFMWTNTIECLEQLKDGPGSGCILAHCMGLGKTIQVIAFLHTCLTNKYVNEKIRTALVICPYNTILNWANEFDQWLKNISKLFPVHHMVYTKENMRLNILKCWKQDGGVLIISYNMFRSLSEGANIPGEVHSQVCSLLLDPGPDVVICDEGHILKNEKSGISKATNKLKTKRRIILTGTPLQNNLKEYYSMLQFVKPYLLGTAEEFRNRFVNPIMNGQYDDSSQLDVILMNKRVHILHKILEACVQRYDYSELLHYLPMKHEFVIRITLSELQIKMYRYYLEHFPRSKDSGKFLKTALFADLACLRKIWTYPFMCYLPYTMENQKVADDDTYDSSSSVMEEMNDPKPSFSYGRNESGFEELTTLRKLLTQIKPGKPHPVVPQWYLHFISEEDKYKIQHSGKMALLLDIVKECEIIGDKLIIFSQSLQTLDMIENLLSHIGEQTILDKGRTLGTISRWVKNFDYFRMDGSTSAKSRIHWIDLFNDLKNKRTRLFLISTCAGSLGTNLVGANRVVLLDVSWNPSHDAQAIFRTYRLGQTKPVFIYRLLAQGTMEEKMYERQVTKQSLSYRVVDEQQIQRHFSAAKLAELYSFDPKSMNDRPTPLVPNDHLLAEILIRNKDWIFSYHEHDSLLQNETDNFLTEQERQMAWTEYENARESSQATVVEYNVLPSPVVECEQQGLGATDIMELANEPDFTSSEYPANILPNINDIIKYIICKVDSLHPNIDPMDMKSKILEYLNNLLAVYKQKHVKTLRMRQKWYSKGADVTVMDNYAEELVVAKNNVSIFIAALHRIISRRQEITQVNPIFRIRKNIRNRLSHLASNGNA